MLTFPVAQLGGSDVIFSGNSCNFPGSNDYLSRTHTLSDRRTWTLAFWAKRDVNSTLEYILSALASNQGAFAFPSTNTIAYFEFDGASYDIRESGGSSSTTGTWAHYCLAVDTTDATANDRVKIWKDESQISFTEFDTEPALNFQTRIGSGTNHNIARAVFDGTGDFNGKLAEFCLVDGLALTPSSFVVNGRPRVPDTRLWGSGSVYLNFSNASDLGEDFSGNNNDWTTNGTPNVNIVDYPP